MSTDVGGICYKKIGNQVIALVSDTYHGSPLLCFAPDVLIVCKSTYDKYNEHYFLFDHNKTKVVLI